jgi:hypothetical protein
VADIIMVYNNYDCVTVVYLDTCSWFAGPGVCVGIKVSNRKEKLASSQVYSSGLCFTLSMTCLTVCSC